MMKIKKNNEQNIKKLLDENNEMKNMIKNLEEKVDLLSNENNELKFQIGIISSDDLDTIKKWIDPQNYEKIKFECIYKFLDSEINRDIFNKSFVISVEKIIKFFVVEIFIVISLFSFLHLNSNFFSIVSNILFANGGSIFI